VFWEAKRELERVLVEGLGRDITLDVALDALERHACDLVHVAVAALRSFDALLFPAVIVDLLVVQLDRVQPEHFLHEVLHVVGVDELLESRGDQLDADRGLHVEHLLVSVHEGLQRHEGENGDHDVVLVQGDLLLVPQGVVTADHFV